MCTICNHSERAEIENAILDMTASSPSGSAITIEDIAERFKVDLLELKAHALFHTTSVVSCELAVPAVAGEDPLEESEAPAIVPRESLTRKMKLREADILSAVSNEYLVTLKAMGRRINRLTAISCIDEEEAEKQLSIARLLTKPMVDLYLGVGGEIRQNVKAMAELDRVLNGPEDSTSSGLAALASAIRGSSND